MALPCAVWSQSTKGGGGKLRVFAIDVEGGQATLFVTPAGQSLLVDTGWPDSDGRDANRIAAAVKEAGLQKIDYVLITHYHVDHAGGMAQLLDRVKVGAVIDHGVNREDDATTQRTYAAFAKAIATRKLKRIVASPGDVLPIVGMKATVVSSDGKLIDTPLEGGGDQNPYCKDAEVRPPDSSENGRSVGIQIVFGKLKLLDLGDLTWDKEMELVCPVNKLGRADIYIVSHHGMNLSSSPAMVNALGARVAMMENGAKKGGSAPALETIGAAPGLETLWQLHFSEEGGQELNTADDYIANTEVDGGNYLELQGSGDGSFDIRNSRTGAVKHYAPPVQQ
ncbi:MAG: MBL fold metallo-hydrolase [Acidobacteria bacterium]|nr:MBL fold metallo-hydrolase [Acidobacteriota bacterium]